MIWVKFVCLYLTVASIVWYHLKDLDLHSRSLWHDASEMFVTVDYVREMTAMESDKYDGYGSSKKKKKKKIIKLWASPLVHVSNNGFTALCVFWADRRV